MKESKKFKVIFSLILVTFITVATIVYISYNKQPIQDDQENQIMGRMDTSGFPYITSLPPVVGYEGVLYEYSVKSLDSDTDVKDLSLEYLEGPSWLKFEGTVLTGTPPLGSSGSYKIVLRVSDGYNTSTQESYILINEND